MKPWGWMVSFALAGMIAGGGLALLLKLNQGSVGIKGSATDSPVVVRGGSVIIHSTSGHSFSSVSGSSPLVQQASLANPPNTIYIQGVDPSGGSNPSDLVPFTRIQSNWMITLDFRKYDGKVDTDTTLQICTSWTAGASPPCAVTGQLSTSSTPMLFLVGTSSTDNPKFTALTLERPALRYDLQTCTPPSSTNAPPECDHIFDVTVNIGGTSYGPYHCVNGGCDIGIDNAN